MYELNLYLPDMRYERLEHHFRLILFFSVVSDTFGLNYKNEISTNFYIICRRVLTQGHTSFNFIKKSHEPKKRKLDAVSFV